MADLVGDYLAHPGQCFLCGGSDKARGIFDCGQLPSTSHAKWRLYICGECATGMASQVASLSDRVVVMREEYERLRVLASESATQRDRADGLDRTLHSLAELAAESLA